MEHGTSILVSSTPILGPLVRAKLVSLAIRKLGPGHVVQLRSSKPVVDHIMKVCWVENPSEERIKQFPNLLEEVTL